MYIEMYKARKYKNMTFCVIGVYAVGQRRDNRTG